MKIITSHEASDWCREHGIRLTDRDLPDLRSAPDAMQFSIRKDAGERTAMVKDQMATLIVEESCLIWLNDWSVWPSGQW